MLGHVVEIDLWVGIILSRDVSGMSPLPDSSIARVSSNRLARADFVLLGERHDNPDHHLLQAEVLRSLIALGRRPAVGFEMFGIDDASAIANHLAVAPNDAAGLGKAVNWNQTRLAGLGDVSTHR